MTLATAATVAIGFMVVSVSQNVYGNGWLKIIKNIFNNNGKEYISFGTEEYMPLEMMDEKDEIHFDVTTIQEVYEGLPAGEFPVKFQLNYIPEGYLVKDASYSELFSILNIKMINQGKYLYIAQNCMKEDASFGMVQGEETETVYNEFLGKDVPVFKMDAEGTYTFWLEEQGVIFSCIMADSLEECKKIAENISIE